MYETGANVFDFFESWVGLLHPIAMRRQQDFVICTFDKFRSLELTS